MTETDPEIPLHRIEAWVCDLCLSGAGGECHVPGCSFWCHDAPTGETLRWVQSVGETTKILDASREQCGETTDLLFNRVGVCVEPAGHRMPHRNEHGTSWQPLPASSSPETGQ